MTEPRTPDDNAPDTAGKPDTAGDETETNAQAPAPAAEGAEDSAAALAREAAEYKDRWLRALAEMENLRRRTEREVAEARLYGITQFARDVVTVADHMERALQALDDEIREKADARVKGLLDGVELTERELLKVLEKHGIRRLEPLGQKFDPHRHQAMFEVPDDSVPTGTVVQVVQAGYTIGERVLRPALVGVAKGGPKLAPSGDSEAAAEAAANDNSQGG
jgi:molecular chaperone GrpE